MPLKGVLQHSNLFWLVCITFVYQNFAKKVKIKINWKFASTKRCFLCDAEWQFFKTMEISEELLVQWVSNVFKSIFRSFLRVVDK